MQRDDGREKYRHLVNTCTSQAGPLRVKGKPAPPLHPPPCLSLSLFSSFIHLRLLPLWVQATRRAATTMYSTRLIPFSFPSPRSFDLPLENAEPEVSFQLLFIELRFRWSTRLHQSPVFSFCNRSSRTTGHSRVLSRRIDGDGSKIWMGRERNLYGGGFDAPYYPD